MVKGLARPWDCLRHDREVEHVDAGLFVMKSGYSPMTPAMITQIRRGMDPRLDTVPPLA